VSILDDKTPCVQGERSPSVPIERKREPPKRNRWTVRVPATFFDNDQNPVPHHLKRALEIIESFAQRRCYTWAGVEKFLGPYGSGLRQWQKVIRELIELGWILVVEREPGKYRCGSIIILLHRIDEDLGVFDPAHDSIDQIREQVRSDASRQLRFPFAHSSAPNSRTPVRQFGRPPVPPFPTPLTPLAPPQWTEKSSSLKTTTTTPCVRDQVAPACEAGPSSSSCNLFPDSFGRLKGFHPEQRVCWVAHHGAALVGLLERYVACCLRRAQNRPERVSWANSTIGDWQRRLDSGETTLAAIEAEIVAMEPKAAPPDTAAEARRQEAREHAAEQAAISYVLEQVNPVELECFVKQSLELLPPEITRRNPTLSNPFVRSKVYELAVEQPS
jgi:hypothetical protein